jgi:hypothetical protein
VEEWLKDAQPGKPHEALKPMVGRFKAVVKTWTGPGDPIVSEGVMENAMILGGRYLEGRYQGSFNGQPMEGISLTGYDMKKGELVSLWLDNMSTTWMAQTGALSDDGSTMTVHGTVDGPDGRPMPVKSVTRIVDANQHVSTMSGTMNGQAVPMMEITYTRM